MQQQESEKKHMYCLNELVRKQGAHITLVRQMQVIHNLIIIFSW